MGVLNMNNVTDQAIQQAVMSELRWQPGLDPSAITATARAGVVTLSGGVSNFSQRLLAKRAAMRVAGVSSVIEDMQVSLAAGSQRADAEIAAAAVAALRWNAQVPNDSVRVVVEEGVVQLEGKVELEQQRLAAEDAVAHLWGLRSVVNNVQLAPTWVRRQDVKAQIEREFERSARLDASRIRVETAGDGRVILRGAVKTLSAREDAERAAYALPGVSYVDDRLMIA